MSLVRLFPAAKLRENYPLMDIIGRTGFFVFPDASTLTLTDAGGRAVPTVGTTQMGVRVASFTYTLMASLASRFAAVVKGNAGAIQFFDMLRTRLIDSRQAAVVGVVAALDPASPFRDIGFQYIGKVGFG